MTPRRALVLGGSGFIGRHVCEQLVRAGWQVTVPTRRLAAAQALWPLPGLELVEADVHDPAALQRLLPGHGAVVNLVAILHGQAADFERVHVALPAQLARACTASGVRRLVHVSALGADPAGPSHYQRSKGRGEAVLQAEAGLALTLLRPSVVFGAEDRFLNLFARLQRWLPVLALAGADARFQPVWVEDVARAVIACLHDPHSAGRTYELTGPEVWTLAELVRLAGRLSGHPRPLLPLPRGLGRLQAALMELAPGPTLMSRDNMDSLRVDNVASGRYPGLAALGIAAAALGAVAPGYLAPPRRLDRLRRHAGR